MSAGRRAGGIWDLRITPPLSARVDVSGANGLLAITPSIGSNRRLLEIVAHPEQLTSSALSSHNRQTLRPIVTYLVGHMRVGPLKAFLGASRFRCVPLYPSTPYR
jgi:hypothetical protein